MHDSRTHHSITSSHALNLLVSKACERSITAPQVFPHRAHFATFRRLSSLAIFDAHTSVAPLASWPIALVGTFLVCNCRHSLNALLARCALHADFCHRVHMPMPSFPLLEPLCGAPARYSEPPRRAEVPGSFPYVIPSSAPSSGRFDAWTAAETSRLQVSRLHRSHARGRQESTSFGPPLHPHTPSFTPPWPWRNIPSI